MIPTTTSFTQCNQIIKTCNTYNKMAYTTHTPIESWPQVLSVSQFHWLPIHAHFEYDFPTKCIKHFQLIYYLLSTEPIFFSSSSSFFSFLHLLQIAWSNAICYSLANIIRHRMRDIFIYGFIVFLRCAIVPVAIIRIICRQWGNQIGKFGFLLFQLRHAEELCPVHIAYGLAFI